MASNTCITENRRKRRRKNMGRKRKNKAAKRSTLSYTELFASCGEPGKPAPKSR